jgi:predicted chitinase
MIAYTADDLRHFANHALDDYLEALVQGRAELEQAGIVTPLRFCHFLAQVTHETGGLTIVRENTGWTADQMCRLWPSRFKTKLDPRLIAAKGDPRKLANLAYADMEKIGNCGGDDGWEYRGGGFLQLTGRQNYHAAGNAIGCDLEGQPEAIEDPTISLRAALWEWSRMGSNGFADRNYLRALSNAINRGDPYSAKPPVGFKSRQQWFNRAWALFGQGQALPDEKLLSLGAFGPRVKRLQEQLRELGYPVGAVDQMFGPATARAVAGFKLEQHLRTGQEFCPAEVVDEAVAAALETAHPVAISSDRTQETVKGLIAKGSTEVKAGTDARKAGYGLALLGAADGLEKTGGMDLLTGALGNITLLKSSLEPALAAIQWGLRNAGWVAFVIVGVWCWTKGRQIVEARLAAHQSGANLSK